MIATRLARAIVALAATIVTASAWGDQLPAYVPPPALSGHLTCAGGDTMQKLMEAWARRFEQLNPKTHIDVSPDSKLSADGFHAFLNSRIDCVTFVREPFPSELKAFQDKFGHAPLLVAVAGGSYATKGGTHAIAIYVNAANPLARLDLIQLDAIFSETRNRGGAEITRWGQLGLTGRWKDRPIHTYGMLLRRNTGDPPGIVNYLERRMLLGGMFRDDLQQQVDKPGETALQAIVNRVAADPDGIGYSGFGYAGPGVKSLALAETAAGPYYAGTAVEIARRNYPLSRSIYLMFDSAPEKGTPPVARELIRFVTSHEGQQIVAADPEGFLPLTSLDPTK